MNEHELIEIIKREIEKYYLKSGIKNEVNLKKTIGFLGKDIILKNNLEEIFKIEETADEIVISELSIKELNEISQGTYSTDIGKKLLYNILEGKRIILVKEGIEWRNFSLIPSKHELSFSASHVKRWFALLQGRRLPTISARCPAGVARRRDVRYE